MSARQLTKYIDKLTKEGVPTTKFSVDLANKFAFPWINLIIVFLALPFALISARSGNLTKSFLLGIGVCFSYYVVHALSLAFGGGELLPVIISAWSANFLMACLGMFLMIRADWH